jgi:hypothetical protein
MLAQYATGTEISFVNETLGMEIRRTMNPRDNQNTTDDAEADAGPSQPFEHYVCVDPDQGILVFDWLNGLHSEAKEAAALHLKICLHCREALADWSCLHQLIEGQAQYAHSAAASPAAAVKGGTAAKGAKTDAAKPKAKGSYGGK